MKAFPPLVPTLLHWDAIGGERRSRAPKEPPEPVAPLEEGAASTKGSRAKFHKKPAADARRRSLSELFAAAAQAKLELPGLRQAQRRDALCSQVAQYVLDGQLPEGATWREVQLLVAKAGDFTVRDGLLYRFARHPIVGGLLQLVVPEALRHDYLRAFHDGFGHLGVSRTHHLMRQRVWWPRMSADIKTHVAECHECTFAKAHRKAKTDPAIPDVGRFPFEIVMTDVIHFPKSDEGYTRLLCFVDSLSRWPEARPMKKEPNSREFLDAFLDLVVTRQGVPAALVSDRGSALISEETESMLKRMGTRSMPGVANLHHAAALVERLQQTITELIRTSHNGGRHWQDHVPFILFVLRSATSGSTALSPAFVLGGREPRLPGVMAEPVPEESSEEPPPGSMSALLRLRTIWTIAAGHTAQAQGRDKSRRDGQSTEPMRFEPMDRVLVAIPPSPQNQLSKLDWPFTGPYRVQERLENGNYKLFEHDLPRKVHNEFESSQLRPYLTRTGSDEMTFDWYEIDSIEGRRVNTDGSVEYQVTYVGPGGRNKNTCWTAAENLMARAAELMQAYDSANPTDGERRPARQARRVQRRPPLQPREVSRPSEEAPAAEPPQRQELGFSEPTGGRNVAGLWHYEVKGRRRGRGVTEAAVQLIPARNYTPADQRRYARLGFGPPSLAEEVADESDDEDADLVAAVEDRPRRRAGVAADRAIRAQASEGHPLPEAPAGGTAETVMLRATQVRRRRLVEIRWPSVSDTNDADWSMLGQWLPSWYRWAAIGPVVVTYDRGDSDGGPWRPSTLVAESGVLVRMRIRGELGMWSLRARARGEVLGVYEGRVSGRSFDSEAEAAVARVYRGGEYLITARRDDGSGRASYVLVDGAGARPGGVQRLNDVRGTGRAPDVLIHFDRLVTTARSIEPLSPSFSLAQLADAELLTDYQARFWLSRGERPKPPR
jgi:hypothetical protein